MHQKRSAQIIRVSQTCLGWLTIGPTAIALESSRASSTYNVQCITRGPGSHPLARAMLWPELIVVSNYIYNNVSNQPIIVQCDYFKWQTQILLSRGNRLTKCQVPAEATTGCPWRPLPSTHSAHATNIQIIPWAKPLVRRILRRIPSPAR